MTIRSSSLVCWRRAAASSLWLARVNCGRRWIQPPTKNPLSSSASIPICARRYKNLSTETVTRSALHMGVKRHVPPATNRLRVGYLTSRYPAVSHTFIYREIATLRGDGLRIETFSLKSPQRQDRSAYAFEDETRATFYIDRVAVVDVVRRHMRTFRAGRLTYCRALRRAIARDAPSAIPRRILHFAEAVVLADEFSCRGLWHVHAHHGNPPGEVARIMLDLMGQSAVFTVTFHGSDVNGHSISQLRGLVDKAAAIITVGEFGENRLLAAVPASRRDRVRVIHCGVDMTEFGTASCSASDRCTVLAIGRLDANKGHRFLVRAIGELHKPSDEPIKTIIAGDGELKGPLSDLIKALRLEDAVTLCGVVSPRRVRQSLGGATLLYVPSLSEGIPVTVMEAMAASVPVIATDVGGVGEIIEDGVTGLLVPPGDVAALSSAIAKVCSDSGLRRRLTAAGLTKVRSDFNIARTGEQLTETFMRAQGLVE